jgi:hypothetical protein
MKNLFLAAFIIFATTASAFAAAPRHCDKWNWDSHHRHRTCGHWH